MIFRREEEYVELVGEEEKRADKIPIHIEKMEYYADSDRIQRKVREGAILLVKIKDLREKDMNELKRAVERIRRTCEAVGGDIAGAGEDWLIVTPNFAKIQR